MSIHVPFRGAIPYKGLFAMPGSQLHKHLSEGKGDLADKSYKEMSERERALMKSIDQRFPSPTV